MNAKHFIEPIGVVRSPLKAREQAPRQGNEGAPEAWLDVDPRMAPGLEGVAPGDELVVLTWLHLARRDTLRVHPRDDLSAPMRGVFGTRSADRPNPIGLHEVHVLEVDGSKLRVAPLEAIDGTPIVDLKAVWR